MMLAKNIPGFPNYLIDRWGQVYSMKRGSFRPLALTDDARGYSKVTLYQQTGGRKARRTMKVHVLMFETWIGAERGSNVIDHVDADKTNNALDNLVLVSVSENTRRGWLTSRRKDGETDCPF